jgi:hypothetical protein
MDKKNGKKMKGGTALHGYERTFNIVEENGMVKMNIDESVINYYYELTKLHELIDEKHDQLEAGRGNNLKSNDKLFKQRIIDAINKSTVGNISEFTTGITPTVGIKTFNVNSGIHTLSHALERLGDSFVIDPNNGQQYIASPSLPSLQILPWNCLTKSNEKDELKNCMVVYKRFNTNECNNRVAGCKVNNQVGIISNGIVHDAGSSELFGYITSPNCQNTETGDLVRNIISGKLDSSSSSQNFNIPRNDTKNNEYAQTLIPFMNIYSGTNTLIGVIMLYAAPILEDLGEKRVKDNYAVFLAFKFIGLTNYSDLYSSDKIQALLTQRRTDNISALKGSNTWSKIDVIDQVPNLPEIADFMAGARGCFSAILKYISGVTKDLQNKCQPYVDAANGIWNQLPRNAHVFGTDQDLFVMAFLMKIKHIGDKFRLIDSFMLSETYNQYTATGTIDTFMMRYACLANLYVYCANKGGDMTINDVRLQSQEELAAQMEMTKKRQREIEDAEQQEKERIAEIERQKKIQKCEDRKRNIIGTTAFYVELYDHFFASENGEFKINDRGIFEAKQSSMTRIIDTLGIMKEGILEKGSVVLKPLRMTNRIVNALLNATNENYVYQGVNFTKKEMSTILTYFLTLLSYFDAFHRLLGSTEISTEIYTNIQGLIQSIDRIKEIVCHPDSEYPELSHCEGLINVISDRMNILDKFRLICMFEPKYTGTNHRHLFDDAFRFLKMKNLDMSLAITYLGDYYLKYPELVYTPNIGDVLFPRSDVTVGGKGNKRNAQYGGLGSIYINGKMSYIGKLTFIINNPKLDLLVKLDMITHLLNIYDDILNTLLIYPDMQKEASQIFIQNLQSSISVMQEYIVFDIINNPNHVTINLPSPLSPKTPSSTRLNYEETSSTLKEFTVVDSINILRREITSDEYNYIICQSDMQNEQIYEDNVNMDRDNTTCDLPQRLNHFDIKAFMEPPRVDKKKPTKSKARPFSLQPISSKLTSSREMNGKNVIPPIPSNTGGSSITHKLHAKPKHKTLKKSTHRRKTRKHKKH